MAKKMREKSRAETPGDLACVAPLKGQNVIVAGRRTSMRLEPSMWAALSDIAAREKMSINDLCSRIEERRMEQCRLRGVDAKQTDVTLTSAVRVFIAAYFRNAATDTGHNKAGHGLGDPFRGTPLDIPSSGDGGDSSSDGGGGPPPGAAPFGSQDPQAVTGATGTAMFANIDA